MNIPFNAEAFYGVFTAYNNAVWPMQVILFIIGFLAVALLIIKWPNRSAGISAILAVLWVWQAVAYHLVFFSKINSLAYLFFAVFMVGAAVIFWQGVIHRRMTFEPSFNWRGVAGSCLIFFSVVIYPIWIYLSGHRYPAFPTFGLPCPTTLFTLGLLSFMVKPYPRNVFIVPIAWCVVGSQAAYAFDLSADLGLLIAGAFGMALMFWSKESSDVHRKDAYES